MADYASFAAAEDDARALMEAGTYIVAHAARATTGGKIAVRALEKITDGGEWIENVVAP